MPSRGIAVALGLALGACSLSLDGPDPRRPRNQPPVCDTNKGLVALDTVAGSGFALGGLALLDSDARTEAALPLAISGLFMLAALHGNNTVNACRNAKAVAGEQALESRAFAPPSAPPQQPQVAPRPAPAPTPALAPVPAPAFAPPAAAEPDPGVEAQPPAPPPPQAVAVPKPVPAKPAAAPAPAAPAAKPEPKPQPSTDDPWRDFWKELP